MKNCKYCKSQIDSKAILCPYCHKKQSNVMRSVIYSLCIIIPIYAVIGSMLLVVESDDDDVTTNETVNCTTATVIESAPIYDDAINIFYVTLYENCADYIGKTVTISGPVKSAGNNVLDIKYITISEGIDAGFGASIYVNLHESQSANINSGDYVTVSGIIDTMSFNRLNIDSAIIIDSGADSKSAYDTQKNLYESDKYTQRDITTMIAELDSNALRAEAVYQKAYVEIMGVINTIDSDGKYITLVALNDQSYGWDSIHCTLIDDEQRNIIINKSKGDVITIRGQITSIGEVLGYVLDIHSIKQAGG